MGKPRAAVRAAGWVTVGVVAASGVGVAAAASTSGSGGGGGGKAGSGVTTAAVTPAATSPSPSGSAKPGKRAKHGLARLLAGRLLHGEATVLGKDGKPVQVTEQRGTVQAVSPTSITLKSKDGYTFTYTVTPTTRVRVDGKKSSIANVKTLEQAGVVARVDGTTQTAGLVIERAPKGGTTS